MKKNTLIIGGIAVFVLLVAGAAFVGGRLLNGQGDPQSSSGQPRKRVTPAAGVPITSPDGLGDVTRRDGNSLFICQPNDIPSINENGSIVQNPECAPEYEVIIGHNTMFLHDVTARQYLQATQPAPGQDMVLQEAVEPGSANDISEGTAIRVWGQLTGNRITARTLLYWNRSPKPGTIPKP